MSLAHIFQNGRVDGESSRIPGGEDRQIPLVMVGNPLLELGIRVGMECQ